LLLGNYLTRNKTGAIGLAVSNLVDCKAAPKTAQLTRKDEREARQRSQLVPAHHIPYWRKDVSTKKQTTITVETERVLIVSWRSGRCDSVPAWCTECGALVEQVSPEIAAALARVSPRTIYRWVEANRLHFTETAENRLLICLNSIPTAT
jgi:hypothetical protein